MVEADRTLPQATTPAQARTMDRAVMALARRMAHKKVEMMLKAQGLKPQRNLLRTFASGADHPDAMRGDRVHQPVPDPGFAPAVEAVVDRGRRVVMAWAIDRIGRSLVDLLNTIEGLKACGVPPSKEDIRALIDAAGEELRLMLVFAASTGARAGEQWATRWRDVNFDKAELHISRRVDVYRDEGSPKSAAGVRTVPLSGQLIATLKAWKVKSEFSKADDLIFPNREGKYLGHDNLIKRQFLPLFALFPAVKRFKWHGLRHFAVSCWIEAGLAPKTVQTFAGHASLQVTMDRYGHLFPSDDHRKAMDQIANGLFK